MLTEVYVQNSVHAAGAIAPQGWPPSGIDASYYVLLDAHLRANVDRLAPALRRIAGYQIGWWDENGELSPGVTGKRVRPTLVALSACVFGREPSLALPAAVAVELIHTFSLLHDDVIDGDRMRRHRRSVWDAFGIPAAIVAGDALLVLAFQCLIDAGAVAVEATRFLQSAAQQMAEGQHADVSFETRRGVSLVEAVEMSIGKTASLLECSCALGALFAGASGEQIKYLSSFGRHLGIAFQFIDDLLDLYGDPVSAGKPRLADVRRRKKSLPVVAALAADNPASNRLNALYSLERPLTDPEVRDAAILVRDAGGAAWAETEAANHVLAAETALASAEVDPRPLIAFANLMLRRDR